MRFLISANFNKLWYHYSDHDSVEVNPSPSHQDPLGVYLFPASFIPKGHWENFKFKYEITLKPKLNVLDLGAINAKKAIEIADKAGYPFESDMVNSADMPHRAKVGAQLWIHLKDKLRRNPSAFTKTLRNIGYDAVFDDIHAIHLDEVQMILLNPAKIARVRLIKHGIIAAAKYDHIDFKPSAGAKASAKRGLELRKEFGRGGTSIGVESVSKHSPQNVLSGYLLK